MKLAIATLLTGSAAAFAPAQSSKVSVEENSHRSIKDGNKPLENVPTSSSRDSSSRECRNTKSIPTLQQYPKMFL